MPSVLTRGLIAFGLAALATSACAGPVTERIYPAPQKPLSLAGMPGDRVHDRPLGGWY